MPSAILDQFTKLAVSRGRKHQLRRKALGLCGIAHCLNPIVTASFCIVHAAQLREKTRAKYGYQKRYTHALTYRIAERDPISP